MALRGGKKGRDEQENAEGPGAELCAAVVRKLADSGHLAADRVQPALQAGNNSLVELGTILLTRHGVDRGAYAAALAEVCGVQVADTRTIELTEALGELVSEDIARRFNLVPVSDGGGRVTVFSSDPSPERRAEAEAAAGKQFDWRAADPKTVSSYREQIWRPDADIERLVAGFATTDAQSLVANTDVDMDDQAPVVQLVNRIVGQALRDRASDIHIEPLEEGMRVRFRIDGKLVQIAQMPLAAHRPLVSRLKIISNMNIVETRAPQDGQFSTVVDGKQLDVRVSSVNTVFGEKVVMRLLDKSKSMVGLDQLGFPPETRANYEKIVSAPYGMVICCGPTGAGKTTTLYATLLAIANEDSNVTTIEDPVEYVFSGINQVQTNVRAGLTFATGLKSLLRQDPDVILVGEIRDADTARIAVQAALTGHMVLSSLHGNDAVGGITRLLDMEIEAFLVSSAVTGVVSQRLLRKICDNCKEPYEPTPDELEAFRIYSDGAHKDTFYRGKGCTFCTGTGYRERIGVYELLRVTPELRRLIVGYATAEELRRLAVAQGMRTIQREGMALVEKDITTIAEVSKLFIE
jgi:type IV pilus assembly protein PilB